MPFGYYIGFDQWYFLLVIPAIIISLIAQVKVKSTFSKYSKIPTMRGLTGAQAAEAVLRKNGVIGVQIERVSGELTDHYDPKTNMIRLSDSVYSSNSIAAVGVAAHEAGHAVQYAEDYFPVKLRGVIYPVAQAGSYLSWILIIFGLIMDFSGLIFAGIIAFSAAVLFQLVTLPTEFDASKRAIEGIRSTYSLDEEETKGAKAVLSAAAMTYVAAVIVSLAQLLRLLLLFGGRRRN